MTPRIDFLPGDLVICTFEPAVHDYHFNDPIEIISPTADRSVDGRVSLYGLRGVIIENDDETGKDVVTVRFFCGTIKRIAGIYLKYASPLEQLARAVNEI